MALTVEGGGIMLLNAQAPATCLAQRDERWQRLAQWHPDDPTSAFPFSARLAKENGWSRELSRRAIEEYKRFVFLSLVAGHVVCPSEEVDQVWHMHLTFTESYWDQLCGQILQRPLHHRPTKGGHDEHDKHVALYQQTLASYRHWFGQEPPQDLWPCVARRFQDDRVLRVSRRQYWLLPKPRTLLVEVRRLWDLTGKTLLGACPRSPFREGEAPAEPLICNGCGSAGASPSHFSDRLLADLAKTPAASALPLTGERGRRPIRRVSFWSIALVAGPIAAVWNPLDWPGPDFLMLYAAVLAMISVLGWVIRLNLWPDEADVPENLTPEEIACLQGNTKLTINVAIARLMAIKAIEANEVGSTYFFFQAQPLPTDASELERALYVFSIRDNAATLEGLHHAGQAESLRIEASLRERGLVTPLEDFAMAARWVPCLLTVGVGLFGFTKLVIGVYRDKPVGFLVGFLMVTAAIAFAFAKRPRITKTVKTWLKDQRSQYEPLRQLKSRPNYSGQEVVMAAALFGAAPLIGTDLDLLQKAWKQNRSTSGSSGCGTAGCGTSGCGGGGCGGSGCGGCGGGGD